MSGFSFTAWSAAWLALLAAPVVVFYFLKLKRVRLAVPSLVLWRQVIEDRRVNAPFQKFKRNLPLWLQLLLLLLLVLAAMQPVWRQDGGRGDRLLILLDCSASMAARDAAGVRRIEEALNRVRRRIDGLEGGRELALIAFSRTAQQISGFDSNPRRLHQALTRVRVQDTAADLEDALRMAEAMGRSQPFDRVLLISDGNFPARLTFELPFTLEFEKLPPAGPNLGISELNARRTADGWALFAGLRSSADPTAPARLELRLDGRLAGFQDVILRPDRTQRLVFPIQVDQAADVELRLVHHGPDSLESDDIAHLHLAPPRRLDVEVPLSLPAFRHALRALPLVQVWPADPSDAPDSPTPVTPAVPASVDLLLTDAAEPDFGRSPTVLQIGRVPGDLEKILTLESGQTVVVDWQRTHPLLEYVEMKDLLLLQKAVFRSGADEEAMENLGYQALAYTESGPFLVQRETGQRLHYVMLCGDDRSTLPYRVGFPIFVANLVRQAMHRQQLLEARAPRTGVLPMVYLAPGGQYTIEGPGGYQRQETADGEGLLSGIPAPLTGRYTVRGPGGTVAVWGVSLLQPAETALETVDEIALDRQTVVAASAAGQADRPLWRWLAVLALAVLTFEWWFFQRRPLRLRS